MSKKNPKATGGGKKFSLAFLFITLIAIGASALAGYALYEMKNIKETVSVEGNSAATKSAHIAPLYIPMETFTISLMPTPTDADRVLHIGITLRVSDENSGLLVDQFLPEVRSRLFILLAHQTAENLSTDEGKKQLIEKIKSVVSKPLAPNQSVEITDVLFNAFILR
ncbi:flagellar basal body-associated protein FliL [Yersinia proxima]|uniref:flagellar basal body-associated protein FliL n=1 Tax=Yersinia proxima TaxID=2890316 RepID=UPI001D102274|nr:flagellar basal body-associated protein FliL [Yersinia proxima]